MKHLSVVFVVFILFVVEACTKKASTPEPLPTASPTWGLNKSWQMWGHQVTHYHPSNGNQIPSRYDTVRNLTVAINVIDDTTIFLPGSDTFSQILISTNPMYIEYIPKFWKDIGFRPFSTSLKYYHDIDSVSYFYNHSGVSYDDTVILYTK